MRTASLRRDAEAGWRAGLCAADPQTAVAGALRDRAPDPPDRRGGRGRMLVVATGKASASMVRGLGALASEAAGFVLLPSGAAPGELPPSIRVLYGGHPVPTPEGLVSSRVIADAVAGLGREDLLLYLISGGSSALFEVPAEGLDTGDLIATYRVLIGSGAAIDEINAIRRELSAVKGGLLAAAAFPARVRTMALSDVIGDDPATIGSGPTVACPRDPVAALSAIDRYGMRGCLPSAVIAYLERRSERDAADRGCYRAADVAREDGADSRDRGSRSAGKRRDRGGDAATAETAGEDRSGDCGAGDYEVVASNAQAVAAAAAAMAELGYRVLPTDPPVLQGECGAAASRLAAAIDARLGETGRWALVGGGETTVTLPPSPGDGGRNQHMAAMIALALAGRSGFACIAAGTDGVDGSSAAAGAVVDGRTAARAVAAGFPLAQAIGAFDTATALAACGDGLITGPTGTNVGDIFVAAIESDRRPQAHRRRDCAIGSG